VKCPKCKEEMDLMGKFQNEVDLHIDNENFPQFFNDEVSEYTSVNHNDIVERFWYCFDCNIKVIEE